MTPGGSAREAGRHRARPRHVGPGASRARPDRAPARGGASAHRARGQRSQGQLRDGHHPDRPAARADARPVRQHLARHARSGAADRDRSRQPASGDARRMEALPEQTAQATAAIRKALSEQISEIEAISAGPDPSRAARRLPAPEPYRQAQAPRPPQANSTRPLVPAWSTQGAGRSLPPRGRRSGTGGWRPCPAMAGASYAPRLQAQAGRNWPVATHGASPAPSRSMRARRRATAPAAAARRSARRRLAPSR